MYSGQEAELQDLEVNCDIAGAEVAEAVNQCSTISAPEVDEF